MAKRKVLINLHSTRNEAPDIQAQSVFHGELVVSHPEGDSGLSATTIWTRNNNTMVPFASCAMTMQMIDNAISDADVTYDVKAAQGDAHVVVTSGSTEKAKVFTVSSKDVQSKDAFDAYSAATDATIKANYNTLSGAIDDVLSIITTSITGDSIIKVQPTTSGAGAYKLSHKEATAVTGFNKLATDAYGHVTAATAVAASDIKTLGFEDSAWTEEKIASAITALDVTDAAVAGQYVSSVSETDGKISVSRADVSKAPLNDYAKGSDATAVAATDTVNQAISKLENQIDNTKAAATTKVEKDANANHLTLASSTAADGSVTYTIGEDNIASKTDLDALTGAVESFTAATDAKFTELSAYTKDVDGKVKALSAGTIQLSADTIAYVNTVSGNIESVINAMDKAASAEDGKVVTTVSEVDGVVSETKANVKDLQLGGYVKDANATGAIAGTDTINTALSKLENIVAANEISNADGSIVVTEPTGTATTTDVKVNIKSGEKVIKLDGEGGGLYTNLNLVKITESLPTTVKERYEFRDSDNNKIGESIDIAKDSHIVSITYNEATQKLIYTYLDASGATQTTEVDMAHLILETEVENGIQSVNGKLSIELDTTGDDTGDGKFLTVGADGLKLDGVTDAINAAVNGLNYADTAVAGQYVTEVDETNGVISVQRANVSDAVLNGYAKGEKPASTAIAATDDVKGAIAKLEHQIDDAKAAATTKVVEGTDEGNNMTIVPTTGDDNSVTYTVDLTDVASKNALDAEIAARKAVDGQTGQTYAANTGANYIAAAASLNDADVKLDAALKAVSDKVDAAKVTEGTSVENYVALALDTATTAGTTALTINDSALKTKIDAIDAAITAETKAREDAIADLDSSTATTDSGHYITAITITDGKITAAGQEALPAATPVTTVEGTTGATVAPVLTGIVTGGTEGHALTLNYTNKVLSAQTADEAAHASAATKVDQKLTMTDGTNSQDYDGSAAKSLTFGTATSSTGVNGRSMSMTSAGVVDVEVIDCGEY